MSPRKTRRVAKTEGDDEKSVESEPIKLLNTTDEGHVRTLRARRQVKLKNSNDSDVDTSLQLNESKLLTRRVRGRKAAAENSNTSVNITGPSNRKRNKKEKEFAMLDDSVISDHSLNKFNTTRGRRRGGRKKTNKNTDDEENSENVVDKIITISENDGVSSEDNEVAAASKKSRKASGNTPSTVRFIQLRNRNVSSPNPIVTPESSPITVSLTPHRTTKTPRKSPINIGSPKTHSQTPQRISKTPRKLPVVANSPVPSEQSSINGTPQKKVESQENPTKKINSPKTFTASVTRKSSRSSSESKSPRVISTKAKKSPVKSSLIQSPLLKSPNKKTPAALKLDGSVKSPKLVLRRISLPEIQEASSGTPIASPDASKKVSDEGTNRQNKLHVTKSSHTPLTMSVGLKTRIDIVSSTPRERIRRSLNLSPGLGMLPSLDKSPLRVESFYGISPKISSTRIQHESSNAKIEDVMNPLISDDESFDTSEVEAIEKNEETFIADVEITDDESQNKDDTYELPEPRTPGLRKQKSNDTYELDEPKTPALKKKKKLLNTESISKDKDQEIAQKRVCRVRFVSPPMNSPIAKNKSNLRTSRSATPGNKLMYKRPGFVTKRSPTKVARSSLIDKKGSPKRGSPRKRSSSVSLNTSRSNAAGSKKRSLSSVDVSRKSIPKTLQDSVNRLSKPRVSMHSDKKPEIKPMSTKKIPNFAQIHQKKFSQMESLVDAKNRVKERHYALINNCSTTNSKVETDSVKSHKETSKRPTLTPRDVSNGIYNRYGYKVRKEEAAKIINKQLPTKKIGDTRAEKRMALKGVRSNRRFEMLMQMRNIKH